MYPMGEATSFHCYPCSVEIGPKTEDGAEAKIMRGEYKRYLRQRARWRQREIVFYGADPEILR